MIQHLKRKVNSIGFDDVRHLKGRVNIKGEEESRTAIDNEKIR